MRNPIWPLLALLAAGLAAACGGPGAGSHGRQPVVVFAAASLREVARELAAELERREPVEVVFNFAGSNTLALQIDAAPRADVFLSADGEWVDFLERAGRTVPGSRRALFDNRLVLIARADARYRIDDPRQLATAPFRHLALADPAAVPAGRYARAALEGMPLDGTAAAGRSAEGLSGPAALDLWAAVAERVVPALDVRAALGLVESSPEILGIVYRTDARTSPRVRVLYEFPPRPELPIAYYAVAIAGGDNPAGGRRFLAFLAGPEARAIGHRHGFVPRTDEP